MQHSESRCNLAKLHNEPRDHPSRPRNAGTLNLDWDNLRIFLELARTERLMDAARRLDIDHSTVSRRIRRFEQTLGTRLFERSNQGYALTAQGARLLEHAERIETALQAATDEVLGVNRALSGQVRLGATEAFGSFVIAPHLANFCARHPGITVDLLPVPRFVNLSKHEADLAVTIERPASGSYVVTKLADYALKLYAAPAYLRTQAPIRDKADLARHPFIGYVDDLVFSREMDYLRQVAPDSRVALRSTSVIAQYAAARRGRGLAILPCFLAQQNDDLIPVLDGETDVIRTFWLVVPTERRRIARVDALWTWLRETADANRAFLMGRSREMRWIE